MARCIWWVQTWLATGIRLRPGWSATGASCGWRRASWKVVDFVAERVGGGDVGAGSKVGRVRGDEGVKVRGADAGDDGGAVKVGVVPARGVDEDHVEHRVGQRGPAGAVGRATARAAVLVAHTASRTAEAAARRAMAWAAVL